MKPKITVPMQKKQIFIISILLLFAATGAIIFSFRNKTNKGQQQPIIADNQPMTENTESEDTQSGMAEFVSKDFTDFNNGFEFKANVPNAWRIQYVDGSDAINLFDPKAANENDLDNSQIFIKRFVAKDFLTLSSVDILSKQSGTLKGNQTYLYEISKKPDQKNFPDEPNWRNGKHSVLDVKTSSKKESVFYVFAKNPYLPNEDFLSFIDSIFFYANQNDFLPPIMDYQDRITKKPFGIKVSPQDSPVLNEQFSGYHTGTDFEIYPDELEAEIPVHAICYGEVVEKKQISGYGGVIIQECTLVDQPITVLYGHLSFSAEFTRNIGKYLIAGDLLATLGDNQSVETDGERKHLHLGIHRGSGIDVRGYVQEKNELNNWIDFEKHVAKN